MTIKAQLEIIRDALKAWGKNLHAKIEVGHRVSELFAMFETGAPQGLRVKVLYTGETKRGDLEEAGIVDRNFLIVLSTPRSLAIGADDTQASNATQPPYDLVDGLRDALRGLAFETDADVSAGSNTTENRPDFKGVSIFQTPTQGAVDGYQFEISIGTQLPAVA